MAEPVTARTQDSWVHQERCTKQGNCLPCPNTATDALSCHLTSFSVTVRGRERLEDTRLLVRDMFFFFITCGLVCLGKWVPCNSGRNQWLQMLLLSLTLLQGTLACCYCCGNQCHGSHHIPTLDLNQEAEKQ